MIIYLKKLRILLHILLAQSLDWVQKLGCYEKWHDISIITVIKSESDWETATPGFISTSV